MTAVRWQRENLFGEIVDGEMRPNRYAAVVQDWWNQIPVHFPSVETGAFMIMPNHVHGIIVILSKGRDAVPASGISAFEVPASDVMGNTPGQGGMTPPLHKPTLGQIVAYFKYQSTKQMNALDDSGTITRFWQRNYYEHIIRNEREMQVIWSYIESNPARWASDDENRSHV